LQKVKDIFVFSDLIITENKRTRGSIGKEFIMIKIGRGFMGSLENSLIKLWWH
jgi:hypothetical protein